MSINNCDSKSVGHSNYVRVAYMALLYFGYFVFGIYMTIFGPAMQDLKHIYHTSIYNLSYGTVLLALTYGISSFVAGIVFNHINRQLTLAISFVLLGGTLSLLPLSTSLWTYYVIRGFTGIFSGFIDTATNAWMLELLVGHRFMQSIIQGMHTLYACGSIFSPLLVKPFLNTSSNDISNTSIPTITNPLFYNIIKPNNSLHSHFKIEDEIFITELDYAFYICGALLVVCGALGLCLFFYRKYEISNIPVEVIATEKTKLSTTKIKFSKHEEWFIVLLGAVAVCFDFGIESNSLNYYPTFIAETYPNKRFAPQKTKFAANVSSGLGFAYASGRGLAIILAAKLRSHFILAINIVLIATSSCIFLLSEKNESVYWMGCLIQGFGMSSVYGTIYTYCEERIRMVNLYCSVFLVAANSSGLIYPILIGKFIESHPMVLIYFNTGSVIVLGTTLLVLHCGTRHMLAKRKAVNRV